MPQPKAPAAKQRQNGHGAAIATGTAAAAGAVVVAAPGIAVTDATTASMSLAAKRLTASILAAFVTYLSTLRQQHQTVLVQLAAGAGATTDDVTKVTADEMRLENEFAKNSADRVASKLPAALAIKDPAQRGAAIEKILADEQRFAQQRTEAMAARAASAFERLRVRRSSPLGAYWELGSAHKHTEGCLRMKGKFWPWEVLDRVHPPRHYGCTSRLLSKDEAVGAGLMTDADVPNVKQAIRAAAGVMQEGVAVALLKELQVRDELVEMGVVDPEKLGLINMEGVRDGTANAI
jgi:hypothetical protein